MDLENFQPLARFKVEIFAEVTKFVLASSVTPLRPRQQQVSVSIVSTNKRTYVFPRCQTERLKLPSDYL